MYCFAFVCVCERESEKSAFSCICNCVFLLSCICVVECIAECGLTRLLFFFLKHTVDYVLINKKLL